MYWSRVLPCELAASSDAVREMHCGRYICGCVRVCVVWVWCGIVCVYGVYVCGCGVCSVWWCVYSGCGVWVWCVRVWCIRVCVVCVVWCVCIVGVVCVYGACIRRLLSHSPAAAGPVPARPQRSGRQPGWHPTRPTACQMTPNKSLSETQFPQIKAGGNNTDGSKLVWK